MSLSVSAALFSEIVSHRSINMRSKRYSSDRRIFVQIPAYRDPELSPTLNDLFSKARNPARSASQCSGKELPTIELIAGCYEGRILK